MTARLPKSPGTVFIVDDDASHLRSVSRLLRAAGHMVEAFISAQDFLARLTPNLSGCVVADLQMPELDGLKLQAALNQTTNPLPIIFLTGQGDIPTSVTAMRHGAEDFLTKLAPMEELLAAVDRALARAVQERQKREHSKSLRDQFAALNPRELEILQRVVQGKMNKEIAAELDIHLRTVKLHRTNIGRKLQVRSVAELTRLVDAAEIFGS